jgi:hypothetical protein
MNSNYQTEVYAMNNLMPTFQAAIYLYAKLSRIEPKCKNVDFHSLLKENQRDHLPNSAISRGVGRGNRNIYGFIGGSKNGRKVVYERRELDEFIQLCKLNPSLIEFMTRSVV